MSAKKPITLIITLCFALCPLLIVMTAHADGDLAFLTPTHTTITAGEAFSWMERSRDWNQDLTSGVTTIAGITYAIPNVIPSATQDIHVETWRETSGANVNLKMHFSIPDVTRTQPPGSSTSTLNKGDRIIIELDPDNSGRGSADTDLTLGAAGSPTTDYRFEIVIKDNLIDNNLTGTRLPVSATPNNWDTVFDSSALAPTDAQLVTLNSVSGGRYDLTVTIPGAYVGLSSSATGPVGMTFVYLNDIGHSHPASGGGTVWEMIGTQFPSSMGLSVIADNPGVSDLGLATSSLPASGSWLNPSQWASGYFDAASSSVTNDINFSASPDWYISEDIRLGVCTTTSFNDFPAGGVAGWATDQLTLPNWYQYYPGTTAAEKPCTMRIWFKARRTAPSATAIRKRFLIVWGRPFIGATQDWFVANLSPPVTITAATDTFNFLWNVPKVNFTDHPCLRIYALPDDLKRSDGTAFPETSITGITTDAQLTAMESFFGVGGHDPRSAQMNFTALHSGPCPNQSCQQAALPNRDRRPADPSGVQIVAVGYKPDSNPDPLANFVPGQSTKPGGDKPDTIRIFVEGFGVETPPPNANYAFLKSLGGVGTMVSNRDLASMPQGMTIGLDVGNPRVERADITKNPSVETLSPPRTIFLNVIVKTAPGVPKPTFTVNVADNTLGPGETTKGTVVVTPGSVPPQGPFKRWGFSLHAGASVPHGNFNTFFNPGPNLGVDLEYRINKIFSLEGIYTFHHFPGETFSGVSIGDLNLHQFSFNGKVYGNSSPLRPFVNFGGGAYKFDPGSTHGGLNIGGGLQVDITPTVALDGMYNFHNVFTNGSNTQFSTAQVGVRFRF
jgi:hypothetical protein